MPTTSLRLPSGGVSKASSREAMASEKWACLQWAIYLGVPSSPQEAPRGDVPVSQSVTAEPPRTDTFFSFDSAKKSTH